MSAGDQESGGKAGRVLPIGGEARGRCPLCGKPTETRYRPFCSRRCADRDLHKWLTESYAVPSEEAPPDATAEDEEEPR